MLGAIIGDIAGSRFEFNNFRRKDFELLSPKCFFTDDSVMSLALCSALMESRRMFSADEDERLASLGSLAVQCMQDIGRHYPDCGYGGRFGRWMFSDNPAPYGSYGNGAAMRVSGCGWAASSLEEALKLADTVTAVTHDHPEGLKGARAAAAAVYMARTDVHINDIRRFIEDNYYKIDFTLDDIRDTYRFNETCQDTVPQALEAFFESTSFEDAIRCAVSVGGDSDTLAAITGGIAEAYYGVPNDIREKAETFLDERLGGILAEFERMFPPF